MNFCCLCGLESSNCLNVCNNSNSSLSNYNDLTLLISKYFCFLTDKNSLKTNFICIECWEIVKNFHELYIKVEEAHRNICNLEVKKDNINDTKESEVSNAECIKLETEETSINIPIVENDNKQDENNDNIDYSNNENEESLHSLTNGKNSRIANIETEDHINVVTKIFTSTERTKSKIISERAKQYHEYDNKVSNFMTLKCALCSEILPTFGKLKTHFQKVHKLNGYAVCCKRKYYKRNLLIDHIDTHLNPEHFKCPTCGKTFTNKESHQTHIKTFHLSERIVYQCDECPKKFSWRYVLLAHKKTHAPKEEWKYKCQECDKTFASHTFLSSHKHYAHKITKKICDLCGKSICSNLFRKHQLKHSGIVQPKIQCEICGSWLNKKYIKIHLRNHEESGIEHICTHCGKISPNSKALYKHVYEVHTLKKTLKCNVCDKTFKSKDLLTQHMPVHTGENNFLCQYCPRTFKFKSNWHEHKKREHFLQFKEERQIRLSKMNINSNNSINKLIEDQNILKKEETLI